MLNAFFQALRDFLAASWYFNQSESSFVLLNLLYALFFLRIFLLHSRVIHGWLNLGEVILLGTCIFCMPVMCLLDFVHKFSIGVFMKLVVVNMDIIFLILDMRLSKSTFFHMKTSRRRGFRILWLTSYIY